MLHSLLVQQLQYMCIHVCVCVRVCMPVRACVCVCFCVFRGFHCLLCSVSRYIITWCFGLASIKKKETHTQAGIHTGTNTDRDKNVF